MSWLHTRLTYANVMSTIAVFAVLGGGAYAAAQIGAKDIKKNAVRSKAIKAKAVKSRHLKAGAVTTDKVGAGAVTGAKLAPGVLGGPAPPTGPAGGDLAGSYPSPTIVNGAVRASAIGPGAVNASKLALIVEASDTKQIPNNGMDTVTAICPQGSQVLSGGGTTSSFAMTLSTSQRTATNDGWTVAARNATGSAQDLTAFAYCLDGPN